MAHPHNTVLMLLPAVMNFQLKNNHEGGSFEFKPGIYQQGDGRQFAVAVKYRFRESRRVE